MKLMQVLEQPVPFAQSLGNLRFFASYRQTENMYVVPLSTDGVNDWVGQLKLTSDLGEGKKLMVQGLLRTRLKELMITMRVLRVFLDDLKVSVQ